jgi:outer membrane protein TolC
MRNHLRNILVGLIALVALSKTALARETLFLNEVLKDADQTSPQIMAARYQTAAAREQIRAEKSGYLPSLDAAAIATDGGPGAFALLGVDNNISSTERIGVGGALILKQDLWDFGRTGNAVAGAKAQAEVQQKQENVTQTQVDLQVLQTYFQCTYLKSQADEASMIAKEAQYVAKETNKFVQSGQRSIVERYLIDAQTKESETKAAEYQERLKMILQRLEIELGRDRESGLDCPKLDDRSHDQAISSLEGKNAVNPFLEEKKSQVKFYESQLDQAKAGRMPELLGIVSGGYFQNDQLNEKWNYSAGIGITLPLFEGFKIDAEIGQASANLQAQKARLSAVQQEVSDSNKKYDEQIQALKVRLDYLDKENKLAHDAYLLARKRYFNFQGGLLDLREAMRNLDRVLNAIDEAQRDLFIARGGRALFNGVRASE